MVHDQLPSQQTRASWRWSHKSLILQVILWGFSYIFICLNKSRVYLDIIFWWMKKIMIKLRHSSNISFHKQAGKSLGLDRDHALRRESGVISDPYFPVRNREVDINSWDNISAYFSVLFMLLGFQTVFSSFL